MKHFYKKIMIALIMVATTSAHAADAFSHSVLILLDNPRIDTAWSKTISSQEEWEKFYYAPLAYMTFAADYEFPVPSTIDFEEYQILTGGIGVKFSNNIFTEYSLSVEKVIEAENEIVIHVLDISQVPTCAVIEPFIGFPTYPTATVVVKKTDKPFRLDTSKLTENCP